MSSRHLTQFRRWFLNSPPAEWAINQVRELLVGALRQGPIPQHVAFVMDGNRRFARNHRIEAVEGHNLGFEALARILEVCYKAGVKVVTIYAFSVENFKRSKVEVDGLMEIAKLKSAQLIEHGDLFDRYGASVRILGDLDLLRPDVRKALDKAVKMTEKNGNAVLNVCFPYTSRDEITHAVRETVVEYTQPLATQQSKTRNPFSQSHIEHSIRSQSLASLQKEHYDSSIRAPSFSSVTSDPATDPDDPSQHDSLASSTTTLDNEHSAGDGGSSPKHPTESHRHSSSYPNPESITSGTLNAHMFTAPDPPLDILIRTSGVERLSDFMLWQCHQDTEIVFLRTLWPEFDLWQFLPVIWQWQYKQRRRGPSKDRHLGRLAGLGSERLKVA